MNLYDLDKKSLKELVRLYPKVKIPMFDKAEYYLFTLSKTMNIQELLDSCNDCFLKHGSIESYKMKKHDEIIAFFKSSELLTNINNATIVNDKEVMFPKNFNNWSENKIYVSIDMIEANWSVFKNNINSPSWIDFVTEKFDLHPFIANSKSFRQIIFGNLNPSRIIALQKEFIKNLAIKYVNGGMPSPVMVSNDEILFEFEKSNSSQYWNLPVYTDLQYNLRIKKYFITKHENFEEQVLIKNELYTNKNSKELFAVIGTRFFIHYKTLILNELVIDEDLFFEAEPKRFAKWVI